MKPELKYGLIAGAGVSLWSYTEYLLGLHSDHLALGEYTGYGSSLIPLLTLFLLLKGKQDALYDRRLGLAQGINAGLSSSFVAALIVYGFMLVYDRFIHPGWLDHALEWKVGQMRTAGLPETAIRREITFQRQAHTPLGLVGTTLVGMTLLGALFSFVLTLFLRQRPRS